MVFRPGCLIYVQCTKPRLAMQLKRMDKHMHSDKHVGWEVIGEQITYDGDGYGYSNANFYISHYEDRQSLQHLKCYPLQYSPKPADIRRQPIARGQDFVALRGVHHKSYHGVAEALAPFRNVSEYGEEAKFPLRTFRQASAPVDVFLFLTLSRLIRSRTSSGPLTH